jgi:hypothetical protein
MRMTMYTPAETMVAAWIMAETGVGPSMASGSQTCSGPLGRLADRADEQQQADQPGRDRPKQPGTAGGLEQLQGLLH